MSIENFKNPWAEGGEYYPDHLDGEKVLGGAALPNKNIEYSQFNEVKAFRLFFYGGSRSDDDLFLRALNNVKDDYDDSLDQKVLKIENAQTITRTIRASLKNTIQSLDVFSHGGPLNLYFKTGPAFGSNYLYRYESDMGNWNSKSDSLQNIKYEAFTDGAKVEFHGCNTGSNAEQFNFARVFSFGLQLFGKKNAVVIGHADAANPNAHSTLKGDDYRHGLKRVFHAGETLFLTKQEGRISADTINFYLQKKSLSLREGKEYIGENQKTWKD
jgi:hypothetical protein